MSDSPLCLGQFMNSTGRDCGKCTYRVQCYEIFRDREKKLEEIREKQSVPWFKKPACAWLTQVCETCG